MLLTIGLGCLIGVVMGITGAGGGILAIPALVYGLHMSMSQAAPTALIAIALAAGIGAVMGLRNGLVRYRAAMVMAVAGMLTSPMGAYVAGSMPHRTLVLLFSGVLTYIAYSALRHPSTEAFDNQSAMPCKLNPDSGRFVWNSQCAFSVMLAGAMAGCLSGMLGVGGGFVVIPALQAVSSLNKEATVATALAVIAIVSSSAAISHAFIGEVLWQSTMLFTVGAMVGIMLGSAVLTHLRVSLVKRVYAGLLIGVIFFMLNSVI